MTLSKAKQAEKQRERKRTQEEKARIHKEVMQERAWERENPDEVHWTDEKFEGLLGPLPEDSEAVMRKVEACADAMQTELVIAGRWLLYLKKLLPHGGFTRYIEDRCPFGERTARNLMRVALWEDRHPHLRSEWPRLRKLNKTQFYTLFGVLENHAESIIEGKGPASIPNLDVYSAMKNRAIQAAARKLEGQKDKGSEQLRQAEAENRKLREENKALKIGPQTDREWVGEAYTRTVQIQEGITSFVKHLLLNPKSQFQRAAALGILEALHKFFLVHDLELRAHLDIWELPGGEWESLKWQPDGVNIFTEEFALWLRSRTDERTLVEFGDQVPLAELQGMTVDQRVDKYREMKILGAKPDILPPGLSCSTTEQGKEPPNGEETIHQQCHTQGENPSEQVLDGAMPGDSCGNLSGATPHARKASGD